MQLRISLLLLLLFCLSCGDSKKTEPEKKPKKAKVEIDFDKEKWSIKQGRYYPYRAKMLNSLIENDKIRSLNKSELLELLGEPNRTNENYLYYELTRNKVGFVTLSTRTLVFKFDDDNNMDWVKIHG